MGKPMKSMRTNYLDLVQQRTSCSTEKQVGLPLHTQRTEACSRDKEAEWSSTASHPQFVQVFGCAASAQTTTSRVEAETTYVPGTFGCNVG